MKKELVVAYSRTIQRFLNSNETMLSIPIRLVNMRYEDDHNNFLYESEKYVESMKKKIPELVINSPKLNNASFFGVVNVNNNDKLIQHINDLIYRKNICQGTSISSFYDIKDFERFINNSGYNVLYISCSEKGIPKGANHINIVLKTVLH